MLLAKCCNLHIKLDHERAVQSLLDKFRSCQNKSVIATDTEHFKDHKEDDLKEVPATAICHLEKNELPSTERIHDLYRGYMRMHREA